MAANASFLWFSLTQDCYESYHTGTLGYFVCLFVPWWFTHTHTHTVHMALMGYFIVFSFVTKPGQTLEFLLWGTIVPLNFLAGYYCSIVASTPQPTVYASMYPSEGTTLANFIELLSRKYCLANLSAKQIWAEYQLEAIHIT